MQSPQGLVVDKGADEDRIENEMFLQFPVEESTLPHPVSNPNIPVVNLVV